MEIVKLLIVKGNLWIPLTVFLVLYKLPEFVEFLERRKEAERERKEEKRQREEQRQQEPKERWKGLINEMGYHVGETENLRRIHPSKHDEYYKTRQKTFIRYLREFGFFMPSETEMIRDDFHERWLKFLKEFFEVEEIHRRYPDEPPKEKELITLWERC